VREVGFDAVAAVERAMGPEAPLAGLRLGRGCRCFATWMGDEVAGYGWLSTGSEWIGELGLEIRLPAGEAYVWNCVTLPAHRLRGCFRTLLLNVIAITSRESLGRLWIGSVDGGAESAVLGAGFAPVLNLNVITFGGLSWLAVRPATGADSETVAAALRSLGGAGALRSGLRRAQRRIH
jgi:hypothetical protein